MITISETYDSGRGAGKTIRMLLDVLKCRKGSCVAIVGHSIQDAENLERLARNMCKAIHEHETIRIVGRGPHQTLRGYHYIFLDHDVPITESIQSCMHRVVSRDD